MEVKREYKYDNIKCIMIFLVVFAHFLEILNGNMSKKIYIFIYTFHMPIFVYISGYFSKGKTRNIMKFAYIYLIWQTIFYLFDVIVLKSNIKYSLTLPNWTLWYIFAMIIWNIIIKFLDKILIKNYLCSIIISIIISLLAGYFKEIGYEFCASRILTFFPYFLLGYINKNVGFKKLKMYKCKNLIIGICSIISIVYFIKNITTIRAFWLYGSFSYRADGYTIIFKSMWIILSLVELYVIYKIVPNKKIKVISNIGANTLNIYLLHSLIIKWLKVYAVDVFGYTEIINIAIMIILTCIIVLIFGSEFIKNRIIYLTDLDKVKERSKV